MKTIKFRVWTKGYENSDQPLHMMEVKSLGHFSTQYVKVAEDIMQFTGMKDMNDKEIYEGDILEWPEYNRKHLVIAKYYEDSEQALNGFILVPHNGWCMGIDRSWLNRAVVIGNIYENPGFLSQNKEGDK